MAHGIILSKDRPAQAHLCIESILKNSGGLFDTLTVLYDADNTYSQFGYDALGKAFPNVTLFGETNYYENVKELVDIRYGLTAFFTDDDVMYNPIPVDRNVVYDIFDDYEDVLGCLSLRLGMNTVIQDPYIQSPTQPPSTGFHQKGELVFWRWNDCPPYMNFGYPMSVDGHIFRTNELEQVIAQCRFTNPNQHEIAMSGKANLIKPLMASFTKSVIVNTPINRVQSTCMNRAGETCGQNPADMIEKYLSGLKLDLNSFDGVPIVGCHQEVELKWITK